MPLTSTVRQRRTLREELKNRYGNVAEEHCAHELTRRGFAVTKRGWPDFMAWDDNGNLVAVVEVKPSPNSRLKDSQRRVMAAFHRAGIPCYRYDPVEGFTVFPASSTQNPLGGLGGNGDE